MPPKKDKLTDAEKKKIKQANKAKVRPPFLDRIASDRQSAPFDVRLGCATREPSTVSLLSPLRACLSLSVAERREALQRESGTKGVRSLRSGSARTQRAGRRRGARAVGFASRERRRKPSCFFLLSRVSLSAGVSLRLRLAPLCDRGFPSNAGRGDPFIVRLTKNKKRAVVLFRTYSGTDSYLFKRPTPRRLPPRRRSRMPSVPAGRRVAPSRSSTAKRDKARPDQASGTTTRW